MVAIDNVYLYAPYIDEAFTCVCLSMTAIQHVPIIMAGVNVFWTGQEQTNDNHSKFHSLSPQQEALCTHPAMAVQGYRANNALPNGDRSSTKLYIMLSGYT